MVEAEEDIILLAVIVGEGIEEEEDSVSLRIACTRPNIFLLSTVSVIPSRE